MLEKLRYRLRGILDLQRLRIPLVLLLCAVTAAAGVLLHRSVRTVHIFDGESRYLVRSLTGDISTALSCAGLKSDRYRIVTLSKNRLDTAVEIEYTFPVYITSGDTTRELETACATVAEILAQAGFTPDEYDLIEPAPETVLTETAYIDYTDIDYVSGSYTEPIPCVTETVYAADLPAGTVSTTAGSDGLQQVNYTTRLVNGVTAETRIDGTLVLTAAVNAKQIVGTRPAAVKTSSDVSTVSTLSPSAPIELDASGIPVNYTGHMTVQATAYTYTGHNCSTGVAPQPGYIAVNPNVIPYGTRMYIVSSDGRYTYGYAVAADTGSFIKSRPNNVDLFFSTQSACTAFGRRNVEIYILP